MHRPNTRFATIMAALSALVPGNGPTLEETFADATRSQRSFHDAFDDMPRGPRSRWGTSWKGVKQYTREDADNCRAAGCHGDADRIDRAVAKRARRAAAWARHAPQPTAPLATSPAGES